MINVYRASAGSGKTHTLTLEYLKLLFTGESIRSSEKYKAFRHILAVTFTNKATDEMKQRILGELDNLARNGERSDFFLPLFDHLNRKQADNGLDTLSQEYIKNSAKSILTEILHDYAAFNISTIDRFFQQMLRTFAREIGHFSSYNLELDQTNVILHGIDMMMSSLESKESEDLLQWLIDYSVETIERGDSWNIQKEIFNLGKLLFSESFKERSSGLRHLIGDRHTINQYKSILTENKENFEREIIEASKAIIKKIQDYGLRPSDFKQGNNSGVSKVAKWANGEISAPNTYMLSCLGPVENWYTKAKKSDVEKCARNNSIIAAYNDGLHDMFVNLMDIHSLGWRGYKTSQTILSEISITGILTDLHNSIKQYARDQNLMLISESTELLNKIIDGSDTPFVYERIGTRIENFMLDEFQDTSHLQWSNFKPLLSESNASGRENLVVGDEKQSIYRWRGSDWKLLNRTIFGDFGNSIKQSNLGENYRSTKEIVDFNNTFFEKAAIAAQQAYNSLSEKEDNTILDVYSSVTQSLPKGKGVDQGYVNLNFITSEKKDDYVEEVLNSIADKIGELLRRGYRKRDIAVLVRTKAQGADVAEKLLSNEIDVVSNDSLYVASSSSVKRIVSILSYIADSSDSINKFSIGEREPDIIKTSIYQTCEGIIDSYLDDTQLSEVIFIQAFLDKVIQFESREGSDILGFLEWWKESCNDLTVSIPDDGDAVNVLTIHKAKGLGFKVVILPFVNDKLFRVPTGADKKSYLWCTPSVEPFNYMPLIPLSLKSDLKETIFLEEYFDEVLYSYIDNLNIAYVAFTRAKNELYIYTEKPSDNSTVISLSSLLYSVFSDQTEDLVYQKGEQIEITADDGIDHSSLLHIDKFNTIPAGDRLKLHYNGRDYFERGSSRIKGILLHDILSSIKQRADVVIAIKNAINQGVLLPDNAPEIQTKIEQLIDSVKDLRWFDGTYVVMNEIDIISTESQIKRPDRIMISKDGKSAVVVDYKSGEKRLSSYQSQVKQYMSLLIEMGYDNVDGYIWYFEPESEIIKITE